MKTYQKVIIAIVVLGLCVLTFISKQEKPKTITLPPVQTTISDTNEFYVIEAHIPIEPRDKDNVMSKTMTDIVNARKEEWKIGGALYSEEKGTDKQYPDRPAMKYELGINYEKFVSKGKDTITYVFKNYQFTGGAHGGTGLKTYTFDAKGLVYIQNVLDLNRKNSIALTRILESKLKSQLGEMYNEQMLPEGLGLAYIKDDGSFDKTKSDGFDFISNFEHFIILDDGIRFIFGQYQVAPYAAGMPEVVVSFEELAPYLRSN
ncbi:DUF3298 domain-containing protein [Candidatus Parcubacteria bacterium]|nr:DUF3298 domain-containing protein [Candidatus Parcubacteria bacterium]